MRKFALLLSGALALHMVAAPLQAADKKKAKEKVEPKGPSLHVQCDGNPNNMSTGESAARLLGAVTLLAIFAPPPESSDPAARKLGKDGVAACDQILNGDKTEGNQNRRIELIQARALHNIEAKDYDAALSDVVNARKEIAAAGYDSDPFYRRSIILGLDQIEGAALIRQGKTDEALSATLRQFQGTQHQYLVMTQMRGYPDFIKPGSSGIEPLEKHYAQMSKINPSNAGYQANWLGGLGRFAEAAKLREALIDINLAFKPENDSSFLYAASALDHALAGNWEKANARANDARENDKKRVAAGKPDESRSETAEVLDLYEVVKLQHEGNAAGARRLFTGRSAWLSVPLGSVMEVNRRLMPGATSEDRVGMLAKTAEQLWQEREESEKAEMLAKDVDNKTLFYLPNGAIRSGAWESYSKQVWNVKKKSKLFMEPDEKNGIIVGGFTDYYGNIYAKFDALMLHAALTAKEKGHSHFYFNPVLKDRYAYAQIRFGKAGDPGLPEGLVLTPDPVIAELQALIPSPETLKAQKAAASKKKK
jgi:tetratricopeptide (TPR) repeat protein